MCNQDPYDRIKELEGELIRARRANLPKANPLYLELITHLITGPKSISELAELMVRENRTISQWVHAIKTRYGANIITLADGRKELANPENFLPEKLENPDELPEN